MYGVGAPGRHRQSVNHVKEPFLLLARSSHDS